jgi:hypothetical protein
VRSNSGLNRNRGRGEGKQEGAAPAACHRWPAGITRGGTEKRQGKLREGKARELIAIKRDLRKERKARRDGRARPEPRRRRVGCSRGKERRGRKEKGAPTGGDTVSATAGKKEKEAGTRAAAERR